MNISLAYTLHHPENAILSVNIEKNEHNFWATSNE